MKNLKWAALARALLALAVLALIAVLSLRYAPHLIGIIKEPAKFEALIHSYGSWGVFVFIFFQILQVVVAVIPGELTQIAGGYIYGTVLGTIYTAAGILLGSIIAFYLARLLGSSLLKIFVPRKEIERFHNLLQTEKAEIVMFLLFLIPGLPKDVLVYAAGLTPINALRFFVISTIARLPAQVYSSFIGANIQEQDYRTVVITAVIACAFFVIGYINKDKILARLRHR